MSASAATTPAPRRASVAVDVGGVTVGGGAPIVVQSMTNTDTADIDGDGRPGRGARPRRLRAGAHHRRSRRGRRGRARTSASGCDALGVDVPLIGDFHYIGHKLLTEHPACAEALDKYRINPGNVGFRQEATSSSPQIIELAIRYDKPVRIGVNWGSLDQALLTRLMDENARRAEPLDARAGDARGDRPVGAAVGARAPRRSAWRATRSSSRPRSRRCRT